MQNVRVVCLLGVCGLLGCSKNEAGREGTSDRPETGLQGQVPVADQLSGRSRLGYSRGLRLVGQNTINGLGGDFQIAWYQDCAYVVTKSTDTEGEGVAVIDASDPKNPKLVKIIRDPATGGPPGTYNLVVVAIHEGLHVSQQRGVLLVPSDQTIIGLYDISADCKNPVLKTNFDMGAGQTRIHSGKLSADGRTVYLTHSTMPPNQKCMTVVDIADLSNPRVLTTYGAPLSGVTCHDLDVSKDGSRAYLGYRNCPPDNLSCYIVSGGEPFGGVQVVDTTDVQERRANPQIRPIGTLFGGDWHTETPARIGGRSYVIAAEEGTCPRGGGRIVDITDERNPVQVSRITLPVNQSLYCFSTTSDNTVGDNAVLFYTTHYISVDNPDDASMVAYSWYTAGLRLFNIKDPTNPVEIAYYNPAVGDTSSRPTYANRPFDSTRTYTRFHPTTGHLWFGSLVNAFTIVELTKYQTKGSGSLGNNQIRFSVNASGTVAAPQGQITVADSNVDVKMDRITYMGAVQQGCGSVVEASNALEFRGTGTFNGAPASFRACVADGAVNNGAHTQFVLICTAGCTYNTYAISGDEVKSGNIDLREL